jgi:coenzyme F420 hydrogenase subunit beta
MSYNDSWGKILTQYLPLRCKICPDGVGGFADIVCADAWECDDKGYPLFDERPGVSLVLARTENGARVVADAEVAGALHLAPANLDEIKSMQPGQLKRKRLALSRHLAMRAALKPAPRFKGFNLGAAARQAGVFGNVKSFLGALRRFVAG